MQVVLARVEVEREVVRPGRPDVGVPPVTVLARVASACMWLAEGTEEDVARAHRYAEREGYTVYVYGAAEAEPLARAKADALARDEREQGARNAAAWLG